MTQNAKNHAELVNGVNGNGGGRGLVLTGDRLGWRIQEWGALTGISRPTIWRQIRAGRLHVVDVCGIKIVPRSEAVRLGLIVA
jgi:hypothetical protein